MARLGQARNSTGGNFKRPAPGPPSKTPKKFQKPGGSRDAPTGKKPSVKNAPPLCSHCSKVGHTPNECWRNLAEQIKIPSQLSSSRASFAINRLHPSPLTRDPSQQVPSAVAPEVTSPSVGELAIHAGSQAVPEIPRLLSYAYREGAVASSEFRRSSSAARLRQASSNPIRSDCQIRPSPSRLFRSPAAGDKKQQTTTRASERSEKGSSSSELI
ncbi:tubulin beta chain [Striga asiatica]|uniref:Tubulin beta chain n=1 Tax=Striga asiatica TaxID=4170 RepID=A0A5A7PW60_STRAF|nr:tubulin beta chain [Striga asiatica]